MYGINCHRIKRALSTTNQQSIEETLVQILISLCNIYMGKIAHLNSLTAALSIIIEKVQACYDKEGGHALRRNAGKS